ncbi:MAG: hypothetical protein K8R67_06045 [Desulfobacteraceae bacterium]|nr:hypothetical protein [Desulfobacteraceae bacterium]
MSSLQVFSLSDQKYVDKAVTISEELVSNFYKMSSSEWLRGKYEIKTAKDLSDHEFVSGPFAQVVKYEGKRKDTSLSSYSYNFYTVCLQDSSITKAVKADKNLLLYPFLVYILIHELVHIVRFLKFQQLYEISTEEEVTISEERRVHKITWDILNMVSIDGIESVLEYYQNWRIVPES